MLTNVQPPCSRARVASLEPKAVYRTQIQREQRLRLALLLALSFLALSSPLSCDMRASRAQPNMIDNARRTQLATYQAVLQLIDSYYVEPRRVAHLLDSVMIAVMAQLDPHTFYLDPGESESTNRHFEGGGSSFGLRLRWSNKELIINTVAAGGPAERAGILPGDRLIKVWGQPVNELLDDELGKIFRDHSFVDLELTRKQGRKRYKVRITKNHVADRSVEIAEMLDKVTGYIYLSGFVMTTFSEMKDALRELGYRGMKKLILDLRNNGGGLLAQAHLCASFFLDSGAKLTAVKGRNDTAMQYVTVSKTGEYSDVELIVIVDDGTASAAEVLAGIFQDHDRALIVGSATYGKGLVQHQYPLPDGGALRITASRYFLPSGRCIQRAYQGDRYTAVWPDLKAGLNLDHAADTLYDPRGSYMTRKGRTVYGGQGIIPDIVATFDTNSLLVQELRDSNIFDRYFDDFLNIHAEDILSAYPTRDSLIGHYRLPNKAFAELVKTARRACVPNAESRMNREKVKLMAYAKRWICYRLFPQDGWIVSRRKEDRQFAAALRALQANYVLR